MKISYKTLINCGIATSPSFTTPTYVVFAEDPDAPPTLPIDPDAPLP